MTPRPQGGLAYAPLAVGLALFLSGLAAGAAFLPGRWGWLAWFAYVPLFWLTRQADFRAAFLRGWLFGTGTWVAGVHWFVPPLAKFLGITHAAALVPFVAVCAWQGLMFGFFGWACRAGSVLFSRRLGISKGTALLLTAMPAMAVVEHSFPGMFRAHLATTQYFHLPSVQLLEFTGPAGLAWFITGFNAALYLLVKALHERAGVRRAACIFAAFCFLAVINEASGRRQMALTDATAAQQFSRGQAVKAAVLQGCVPVEGPPGEVNPAGVEVYRGLTVEAARQGAGLVIWPESVYGREVCFSSGAAGAAAPAFENSFRKQLAKDVSAPVSVIMSAEGELPSDGGDKRSYNFSYAAGPDSRLLGFTQKRRLFPFGEFIPLGKYFPVLYRLLPGAGCLSAGERILPLPAGGAKAGVLICFEDMYPELARVFPGLGADLLVDITNEYRFGYKMQPVQHLFYSALRAIENRKFFLRAANTGQSAVIDPCGRMLEVMGTKVRGSIVREVALMPAPTFYSAHGALMDNSGLLALTALLLLSAIIPVCRGRCL